MAGASTCCPPISVRPSFLSSSPPKAYFHFQATFIQSFIQSFIQKQFPDLKPVEDFNFFGFPPINPRYAKAVEIAGESRHRIRRS
jgi:hypothetical protein